MRCIHQGGDQAVQNIFDDVVDKVGDILRKVNQPAINPVRDQLGGILDAAANNAWGNLAKGG